MSLFERVAGRVLAGASHSPRHKVHTVRFRRLVRNVRELVALSEDAIDKLGGEWILDRSYVAGFVARSLDRARQVVFDAAVLNGTLCSELYARLDAVRGGLVRLMEAGPTALSGPALADSEARGGAHLRELEYRLLQGAIGRLALADDGGDGPESGPRLGEVVSAAHEWALSSVEGLRLLPWGRRAGTPLGGAGSCGPIRVVDVGEGVAPLAAGERRTPLHVDRIRSAPLRALVGTGFGGEGGPRRGPQALAVVTEDHATVDVAWPEGSLLIDACVTEHAAANSVYCALRGGPTGISRAVGSIVDGESFHRLEMGPGLTAWLQGRGPESSRRALGRLGEALASIPGGGRGQ